MCFHPLKRLCHWGPLSAISIIKCVTGMTIHCNSMWWSPSSSWGGTLNFFTFMMLSGLTLYNFLSAMFHGPGYLKLGWKPPMESDCLSLQYCKICQGYKAPRSHHCKRCNRCVLKMDHHCPWINNCVGWGNHAHFTSFLLFAVLGCSHSSVVLSCCLYRAIHISWYMHNTNLPPVRFSLYGTVFCIFCVGLSVGVVVSVGMLLFYQVRAIVTNRTGIEDWILEKANHRRKGIKFRYPYDLGKWRNIKQVLNWTCTPVGDGVIWEVAENCDQYTLTREQIEQKRDKMERSRLYIVEKSASGSWFPITKGLGVCLHPPCTDEPRIKLYPADRVLVTRWRKYWLFGEKVQKKHAIPTLPTKGWFPRSCAVEVFNDEISRKDKTI